MMSRVGEGAVDTEIGNSKASTVTVAMSRHNEGPNPNPGPTLLYQPRPTQFSTDFPLTRQIILEAYSFISA